MESIENQTKHEKLSDETIGDLLSSMGNHEAKALTLLSMRPGVIYTPYSLKKEFGTMQKDRQVWDINKQVLLGYCRDSLSEIGLVILEALNSDLSTFGYSISEFGKEIGVPFAGLLLDLSLRYPYSLIDIFGDTKTAAKDKENRSKRSPEGRWKLFKELLTQRLPTTSLNFFSNSEITQNFPTMTRHFQKLNEVGLVKYKSKTTDTSLTLYSINLNLLDTAPPAMGSQVSLTREIYRFMQEANDSEKLNFDVPTLLRWLNENHPYHNTKPSLYSNTIHVLSGLSKLGYLSHPEFSAKSQSEINLSLEQREFLLELVTLLDKFQELDPQTLKRGRELAHKIKNSPELVDILLKKAKEASPAANKKGSAIRKSEILEVFKSSDASILTVAAVKEKLKERDIDLTAERLVSLLNSLKEEGLLEIVGKTGMNYYRMQED